MIKHRTRKVDIFVKKALVLVLALCLAAALLGACGQKAPEAPEAKDISELELPTTPYKEDSPVQTSWKPGDKYPVITLTMADGGVIKAELYPDKAPNTVHNFISLAKSGYFEGRVFHRAKAGFMIQGGSPNGDGTSVGFPYSIKGEFAANGFMQNADLKHTRGVLSMARTNDPNSAGCQFFIMHADYPSLDGLYASFGKVTSGLDVVDKIVAMPTTGNPNDLLITPVAIKSVKVDTFGIDYPAPAAIPAR